MQALGWIGARARWVLILGCLAAFALPGLASTLRPVFPVFVALVYALAVARIDLVSVFRRLGRGRRALWMIAGPALAMAGGAVAGWAVARALGLGVDYERALVLALLAPPIASAAGFCLLLALDAALALEITVAASMLFPLIAPPLAALLLGEALQVSTLALALSTGGIIAAGGLAGVALRAWLGPDRIAREAAVFDGLGAIAMLLFVIPLFDGVAELVAADPGRAVTYLLVATLLVIGPQLLVLRAGAETGAVAIVAGVRSVGIVVAAIPADRDFALFAALYQIPMYGLPLLIGALRRS